MLLWGITFEGIPDPVLHHLRSTHRPVPELTESPLLDEVDDNGELQIVGVWLGGQGGPRTGVSVMIFAGES